LADVSPVPKKDGMGMDYVPVYEGEDGGGGSFTLSVEKVQRLGVGTAPAERRVLARAVRAVGSIQFDERSRAVVTTRFDGWVERLEANITGQRVRKGEALLYLYSPEAVQAEQDYLAALAAREEMAAGEAAKAADSLVDGALQRLGNLGIPAPEVERLRRERKAGRLVPVPAPLSGVVLEKDVVQGQRVMAGEALYRLAATDPVWLIAEVFEQDLRLVVPGQAARVTVLAWPGRVFTGRVAYVYPMLSPETRTGRVRIEIPNPKEELKADMYGDVELAAQPGAPVLAVPDSAVLDTGTRRVLFVERAGGRYEPREVKLGGAGGGFVEVLAGIAEGERVVVRANFLIDAESNMRAALQSLTPPEVKP
jgi:Cu(I)/Ag(I) efflux system membrane fusion protein